MGEEEERRQAVIIEGADDTPTDGYSWHSGTLGGSEY